MLDLLLKEAGLRTHFIQSPLHFSSNAVMSMAEARLLSWTIDQLNPTTTALVADTSKSLEIDNMCHLHSSLTNATLDLCKLQGMCEISHELTSSQSSASMLGYFPQFSSNVKQVSSMCNGGMCSLQPHAITSASSSSFLTGAQAVTATQNFTTKTQETLAEEESVTKVALYEKIKF